MGKLADAVLSVVNPDKESGRVTLITRYGAGKVCDANDIRTISLTSVVDRESSGKPYPSSSEIRPPRCLDL